MGMAVKAKAEITISDISDGVGIESIINFYKVTSSNTGVTAQDSGGRNLISNASVLGFATTQGENFDKTKLAESGTIIFARNVDDGNGGFLFDKAPIYKPSTTYVVKFKVKRNSGTFNQFLFHNGQGLTNATVYIDGVNKGDPFTKKTIDLSDGQFHTIEMRYKTPATLKDYKVDVNQTYFQPMKGESTDTYSATVTEIKLEEGFTPTPWTPAPEDMGWSETIPMLNTTNKYLWNYQMIRKTDGTTVFTKPCIIGVYGDKGATGATGAAGKGVKSTSISYVESSSGTTIPSSGWTTSIPSVAAGSFLWTRTLITYTDNTTSVSYSVGKMGSTGATGATGPTGSPGKGIKSTAITYQAGATSTTAPTGTWQTSIANAKTSPSAPYLWTRTVLTYTDNTTSTSYSVSSSLDGIQVGGRNYIVGSSTANPGVGKWSSSGWNRSLKTYSAADRIYAMRVSNGWVVYVYEIPEDLIGENFTLSFYGKINWAVSTSTSPINIVRAYKNEYTNPIANVVHQFPIETEDTAQWVKIEMTIKTTDKYAGIAMRSQAGDSQTGTCELLLKDLKLELGNVATDWTPAPEDMEERVTLAEAAIIQNTKDITLKASQTEVTGLGTRVSTAESLLQVTAGTVSSTVEEMTNLTSRTSTLEQRADGLEFKIDSIDLEGRNLLTNTINYRQATPIGISNSSGGYVQRSAIIKSVRKFKAGDKLTVQAVSNLKWGDSSTQSSSYVNLDICFTYGTTTQRVNVPGDKTNTTLTNTITVPSMGGDPTISSIYICSAATTVKVWDIKAETGSNATIWTEAPEDIVGIAQNASKVATNYLSFDTNGLMIADKTASTLGANTLIKSDRIQMRRNTTVLGEFSGDAIILGRTGNTNNNLCITTSGIQFRRDSTVIAEYTSDMIYLGKDNQNTATIDLCNGTGTISRNYHDPYYSLDIISDDALQIGGLKYTQIGGYNIGSVQIWGKKLSIDGGDSLTIEGQDTSILGYPLHIYGSVGINDKSYDGDTTIGNTDNTVYINGSSIYLNPGSMYKPYYTSHDTITYNSNSSSSGGAPFAGYISSSGRSVRFVVPLSKPAIDVYSVSISSSYAIRVRQNGKYLYSTASQPWVYPNYYYATLDEQNNISVECEMNNSTNVLNNDVCGIEASFTITFY